MRRALLAACLFLTPRFAAAQGVADAEVLPQGVGALLIQPAIGYGPGSLQRFGRGWRTNRESFIADFNGLDLSEVIAGDSSDALVKLFGGRLGTTGFEGSTQSIGLNFVAAFGVTDRLTFIGVLPYAHTHYTLDAYLTPAVYQPEVLDGNGNVVVPEKLGQLKKGIADPGLLTCEDGNFDVSTDIDKILAPKEDAAGDPLQGELANFDITDLNKVLTSPCLGYNPPVDRFEFKGGAMHGYGDRTYSGFRDLILGAKYQFWHGREFNLAGLAYVALPTGKPDDPNDLFDVPFGDGQPDAALLIAGTLPLGRFNIGASAGYELQFGDNIKKRLNTITFDDATETQLANGTITEDELLSKRLDDATMVPIVTKLDAADVDRKLGDNFYVYSQFGFQILEWLSVGVTLNLLHHFRDEVTGIGTRDNNAPAYRSEVEVRADIDAQVAAGTLPVDCVEPLPGNLPEPCRLRALKAGLSDTEARRKAAFGWHTVRGNLVGGVGLNFNTLPMFLRGEFPLPIIASISISRNLAGQNLDTPDAIQASLVIPFAIGDILDPSTVAFDGEEGEGLPYP